MPLSEQAIENDRNLGVPLIPCAKIFADSEFNCRGTFTATDIMELVNDIALRGLLLPITVRKLWDNEFQLKSQGYEYSLVAGFRRFASYKANEAEFIPATIRALSSEFDCHDVNAVENLQRKDLSLWAEAKSIKHYWMASWTREEVAKRVSKSPGWVQIRYMLLGMEPEIQQAADKGFITTSDLRELYKYEGAERLRMAGRVKDLRKKGEKLGVTARIKKKDKPEVKKVRTRPELVEMMEHIRSTVRHADLDQMVLLSDIISRQGNMLLHRVLAWSIGEISSLDVYMDIKQFCKAIGLEYEIPEFDMSNI